MTDAFIQTKNPATEEIINSYQPMSLAQINLIIEQAQQAFQTWRATSFDERKALLIRLKHLLTERKTIFAQQIMLEMGKPIVQARAEIEKCLRLLDYYTGHAQGFLSPRIVKTEFHSSYICYQPLGVIFAIMPWNFPIWQVLRFLIPAIMAGNAGLLKHAPNVTGCALLIEAVMQDAGFPLHLFQILIIHEDKAAYVIEHKAIKAITLTGSQKAGASVAAQAGKLIKKSVLELGGSDPYLILADANLEHAVDTCIQSRLNNSGQVCIAAKRIIIEQPIYTAFKNLLLDKLAHYCYSDPSKEDCLLGPLARADLRTSLHRQVKESIGQGAKLLAGGVIPKTKGYYYPVTVLENIIEGMPAYSEELFGPVFCLFPVTDSEQAIHMANSLDFGLGAAVFTQDLNKGEYIAHHRLEAGACFVNALVATDPRLPFGGIKTSGFGRELSKEGIREFTNIKTICINAINNRS